MGFGGSQTSRLDVRIYSHGNEPGFGRIGPGEVTLLTDAHSVVSGPTLVAWEYSKSLGEPAGSFTLDVKHDEDGRALLHHISDDDWVDVIAIVDDVRTHIVRGQVDSVSTVLQVVDGAATYVVRIACRDFGRILTMTPIWFDTMTDESVAFSAALPEMIIESIGLNRDPATTVEGIIRACLGTLFRKGKTIWEIPAGEVGMPNIVEAVDETGEASGKAYLLDNLAFFDRDFTNYPNRFAAISFSLFPDIGATVWDFAQTWADLPICEFYTDLLVARRDDAFLGDPDNPGTRFGIDGKMLRYPGAYGADAMNEDNSRMAVIFRDRPFPTFSRAGVDGKPQDILAGPWFTSLVTHRARLEEVVAMQLGRTGAVRKNAFYAHARTWQEVVGNAFYSHKPLWNAADVRRHGFRRLDVDFSYSGSMSDARTTDLFQLEALYKQRVRDFHCMDHILTAGTIDFAHARVDLRIGHKLELTGKVAETQTFYIERIRHSWSLMAGIRTSVDVSRGWTGDEKFFVDALTEIVGQYTSVNVTTGLTETDVYETDPDVATEVTDDVRNVAKQLRYAPFSPRLTTLLSQAIDLVLTIGYPEATGVDASWALTSNEDGRAWHNLIKNESAGWVGRPNFSYFLTGETDPRTGKRKFDVKRAWSLAEWQRVHADCKAGIRNRVGESSATGLGQLTTISPNNVAAYYPDGRAGIGDPLNEAVGMLRYIVDKYTTPYNAWIFWSTHRWY